MNNLIKNAKLTSAYLREFDVATANLIEVMTKELERQESVAMQFGDIRQRATDLVEKGFMPWSEAHDLALSERGVCAAEITELQGNCTSSDFITGDDIPAFIRSVLVHGHHLVRSLATPLPVQGLNPATIVELAKLHGTRYVNRHFPDKASYGFMSDGLIAFATAVAALDSKQ